MDRAPAAILAILIPELGGKGGVWLWLWYINAVFQFTVRQRAWTALMEMVHGLLWGWCKGHFGLGMKRMVERI